MFFAEVNKFGMRRPSICGTSMIFTWSHAMYFNFRSITYKFVSSKNISYEVSVLLLHRRQVHSFRCCQEFTHFSFVVHFNAIPPTSMVLNFSSSISMFNNNFLLFIHALYRFGSVHWLVNRNMCRHFNLVISSSKYQKFVFLV